MTRIGNPVSALLGSVFTACLFLMGAFLTSAPVRGEDVKANKESDTRSAKALDSDGDGLSDYAEIHKYGTDPHKRDTAGKGVADSGRQQRKEFTYTITSVLRVLKPCNPAVMNDDYQDVRVLAQDRASYTLEVVYYPLNTNGAAIQENFHWHQENAQFKEYLQPTPACNWDRQMQTDLLAQLKHAGIDPEKMSDRELVRQVSHWAMQRSTFVGGDSGMPISWFVTFPNGKPQVLPALKPSFDAEKPDRSWTDQRMLDEQILGKSMFYQKKHAACTSTSVYLATILRALGIPTRIVYFIPPADGNDPAQVRLLLSAIHHHKVQDTVRKGIAGAQGFCNHMFNEVYVGKHWVRLNYDMLGQDILDRAYFGLLTHIDTCRDISESDLAHTWGLRSARYPHVTPRLSSINPYMLLRVSDHFGKYSHIPNPVVPFQEFRNVTITDIHWKDESGFAPADANFAPFTDLFIGIKESLPEESHPLRDFIKKAGGQFLLRSAGHLDIPLTYTGETDDFPRRVPLGDSTQFHGLGVSLSSQDRKAVRNGGPFTLIPVNTNPKYRWRTAGEVLLTQHSTGETPHGHPLPSKK